VGAFCGLCWVGDNKGWREFKSQLIDSAAVLCVFCVVRFGLRQRSHPKIMRKKVLMAALLYIIFNIMKPANKIPATVKNEEITKQKNSI
jgi:hypothetical protein